MFNGSIENLAERIDYYTHIDDFNILKNKLNEYTLLEDFNIIKQKTKNLSTAEKVDNLNNFVKELHNNIENN